MASYSNSDNNSQTLGGYKHVWCYQKEPVLHRIKKTGFVWRYACKNWNNNSVAFHSIVMLVMLCVLLSRFCWLPERGPTQVLFWRCTYVYIWTSLSCSSSSSCVHSGHHGLYRVIWLNFNANDSPSWGKETNRSDTISKQLTTGFSLTNTDWDSVTWGCSLTVIVGILNLFNMR